MCGLAQHDHCVACRNADTGELGVLPYRCSVVALGISCAASADLGVMGDVDADVDHNKRKGTRRVYPGSGHPEMKPYVLHV